MRIVAEKGVDGLLNDVAGLIDVDAHVLPVDDMAPVREDLLFVRRVEHACTLREFCADDGLFARKNAALKSRLSEIAAVIETDGDIVAVVAHKNAECLEIPAIENQLSESGRRVLIEHTLIVRLRQHPRRVVESHERAIRGRVVMDAVAFCREEIPKRARARDAQTYSMLIDAVHARLLSSRAGDRFAETLFDAYPAALIDEFQDTDRRQFEIFDRIYRDATARHAACSP